MDKFKIPSESRKHYKRIFYKTRSSIGCSPSIFTGEDFNNKMKWLMIFRQSKNQIEFCDKLKSKEIVEERIGKGYTSETYGVSDAYEGLDFDMMPDRFVLKCNHDSGSVWILNKSDIEHDKLGSEVNKKLSTNHGWNNGEWYYSYVPPRVYAEEYLEYQGGGAAGL